MEDIFCYTSPQTASSGSGPLRGLKTAIQPCFCVADWPTDSGSRALAGFTALEDATVVERLRQAGAVLTGLTRMRAGPAWPSGIRRPMSNCRWT